MDLARVRGLLSLLSVLVENAVRVEPTHVHLSKACLAYELALVIFVIELAEAALGVDAAVSRKV